MYTIYKHLNNEEEIIYIGKSKSLLYRQRQHRENSEWFGEIDSIEYCIFDSKIEMDIAELYYINKYNPKYNSKDKRNDNVSNITIENLQWLEFDMNELLIQNSKKENKAIGDEYLELVKRFITTDKYIVTKDYIDEDVVYCDWHKMKSNRLIQRIDKISSKENKIRTKNGRVYKFSDIILLERLEEYDEDCLLMEECFYLLFSNYISIKNYKEFEYGNIDGIKTRIIKKEYIEENIEWD